MPAPVASGWSGCRVGLAPTGKRRLSRRTWKAVIQPKPSSRWNAPSAVTRCRLRKKALDYLSADFRRLAMSLRMIADVLKAREITTHCPLCGRAFAHFSWDEEHIFPRWIQHHHGLWNRKLNIPNFIGKRYKSVKIRASDAMARPSADLRRALRHCSQAATLSPARPRSTTPNLQFGLERFSGC
jgi:hypothetical protein